MNYQDAIAMPVVAKALKKVLTPEQITLLLQEITNEITDGFCPLCEREEIPINKAGNEIEGEDVSYAAEWREQHYDTCLVTLLEQSKEANK